MRCHPFPDWIDLRAIRDGKISPPPVAKLIGYQIKEADHGFAAFELHPAEHHYNPFAIVHGGILSTLLDTTMTAVQDLSNRRL